MQIALAAAQDVAAVAKIYDPASDFFERDVHYCAPNWKKGVYPTIHDAQRAFEKESLFVLKIDGEAAGAMCIDHEAHPEYQKIAWSVQALPQETWVVHTLGIGPACRRRQLGEKMVQFAIGLCGAMGAKTIRLDTHYRNVPARRLYEKCGFQSLGVWKALVNGEAQEFDVFEYLF